MEKLDGPTIEFVQDAAVHPASQRGRAYRHRWRLFATVFVLVAAAGLAFTFARSPVYRAAATVLTVKPKAVDARSEEADLEHVAIQGRALLSEELLQEVGQTLAEEGTAAGVTIDDLRRLFVVFPIEDTNLVELRAEGVDAPFLQQAVNAWASGYERLRQRQIAAAKGATTSELEDQQESLREAIAEQQAKLAAFRARHDIVSVESADNQAPAKLRGLNDALSRAREKAVEARARLASVRAAIAEGKTVVPRDQRAELAARQVEAEKLRDRLQKLEERFTPTYFETDPTLRSLPQELQELQAEVRRLKRLGQRQVIDEATQEAAAAETSVRALEQELTNHRASAQQFSRIFEQHEALQDELQRFQALHADNAERLTSIRASNLLKYPPVQVVEQADLPTYPIYPHYARDAAISLGGAFAVALFITWLVEYLSGAAQYDRPSHATQVHIYPGGGSAALPQQTGGMGAFHMSPAVQRLVAPTHPAELTLEEVAALLGAANAQTAACGALLLSGLAPHELALLRDEHFALADGRLQVPGEGARELPLSAGAVHRLEACKATFGDYPVGISVAELDGLLVVAGADAGLADPSRVTGDRLWLTYVAFLVRQGARLSELAQRVGPLATSTLSDLAGYSPPGANRPLHEVEVVFPGLQV
jgi:uncharacterized protein involved in exopolysaccharide biosynthesis